MAYYSGAANDFVELKAAIETACASEGWTLSNDVLSREGAYHQLVASGTAYLRLNGGNGQSGSSLTDAGPRGAQMISLDDNPMQFPVDYEIHIFDAPELEVYCVVNFNTDFYQQLSFGQSRIPGVGGSGNWYSGNTSDAASQTQYPYMPLNITSNNIYTPNGLGLSTGFFGPANRYYESMRGDFIHIGLDSWEWWENTEDETQGLAWAAGLLSSLPNTSNQASVLIPTKVAIERASYGHTIIWNPPNVRWTRNDNLAPGEVVQYGTDQWKVYPAYRKDASERNGSSDTASRHSGTLAYAIRYTGP